MSNLIKRLIKLETQLTDRSGMIPGSPQWRTYWTAEIRKIYSGQRTLGVKIPVDAFRALADEVDRGSSTPSTGGEFLRNLQRT
jgi:hypothetical protein